MNRRRALVIAVLLVVAIAAVRWFDVRTRPDRVGPSFVADVASRHAGATVQPLDGGLVRVTLASGVLVDVALSKVFVACAGDRFGCTSAIDHALDDVDRADASTRAPDRASLRPVIVAESAGYRYGFVEEPLVGAYAIRYALIHGTASTFVTAAIAARLGLSADALRSTAIANLDADTDVALEPAGADAPGSYRVRSGSDPAASLLDGARMQHFADTIGARRLYAALPVRGTLALAAMNDASARALDALGGRIRGAASRTIDGGLLVYDVDAPVGSRLSGAVRTMAVAR